MKTGTSIQ